MSAHVCHAHDCGKPVPPKMFACRSHWYALRKPLRDAIWREYRPGQENDKKVTARYMAVQKLAVAELAFRANDERAAWTAAHYLAEAIRYRQTAISSGFGDPLAGLLPAAMPGAA